MMNVSCPHFVDEDTLEKLERITDKIRSSLTVGEVNLLQDNLLFVGFKLESLDFSEQEQ